MQSQLYLILIWDVTYISSAPLQEKGNTTSMCSLTIILTGLVFYTRPEHLPGFITSLQDSICLMSTVVDIRFNRYAGSSAKLVTEQAKLRILVVSEYKETYYKVCSARAHTETHELQFFSLEVSKSTSSCLPIFMLECLAIKNRF